MGRYQKRKDVIMSKIGHGSSRRNPHEYDRTLTCNAIIPAATLTRGAGGKMSCSKQGAPCAKCAHNIQGKKP